MNLRSVCDTVRSFVTPRTFQMSINVYLHPTHTTGTFLLQFNLDTRQKVKLYYICCLTNTPARRVMCRHAAHKDNVHQASHVLH